MTVSALKGVQPAPIPNAGLAPKFADSYWQRRFDRSLSEGEILKKITMIAAAFVAIAVATPVSAQVVLEANGARADDRWGGEVGVGYAVTVVPGLRITPAVGALIYAEDNGRYYFDDNGGTPACRDSTNGRYADKDLCSNTRARAYGRLEATYSIPLALTLGVGARISNEVVPYGTLAFPIAPKLQLKGNVGKDYYAAGLRLGF